MSQNAPISTTSSVFDSALLWIKDRLVDPPQNSSELNQDYRELSQYESILLTRAARLTRDLPPRISAEDLVQETLLEAHKNLHRFNGQTRPEMMKWLARILSNNIADTYRSIRRKKRDINRELPSASQLESSFNGANDRFVSAESTPSFYASASEEANQLASAIRKLPAEQRDAIRMHHLQGQTLANVAKQLGRSRSAVAGLVFRGLQSLRSRLA